MTSGGRSRLERLQLGLTAAVAATCLVSIFAAQIALTLAVAVYLARLLKGQARLQPLALDAPRYRTLDRLWSGDLR